jgi:hypothetical protein
VQDDGSQVCVRDTKVCDFGYELNEENECILQVAHCQKGYVINERSDQCIPEPGFHLPFAFLYVAAGWTYYILRK